MPQFLIPAIEYIGADLMMTGAAEGFGAFLLSNAAVIGYGATILGGMALSYEQQAAAARKAKAAYNAAQTDRMANVVTTIGQRELVLGRVRKAGTMFGRASTGTNKTNLYMAIAIGAHEIDGVEAVYFNDAAVTLDGSGNVTSAPYSVSRREAKTYPFSGSTFTIPDASWDTSSVVVTRQNGGGAEGGGADVIPITGVAGAVYTIGDSGGGVATYQSTSSDAKARVFIYFGGAGQAVSAPLNSAFGASWPSTSTATGVAYLVVEFTYDDTAFPSGLPAVSAIIRGAKVYDPRSGLTAFSENPALLMRHVLTHPQFGKRSSMTAAEDARISAAANACDTSVTYTVGAGTVTRALYTAGTVLPFGNPAKACLDDLAQAMGGSWAYAGGQFFVKAGVYTAPVMSLSDADLAVVKTDNSGQKTQQPITIGTHQARASKVNVITPRIWDSAQDYKQVALTPLVAATLVTRDGCWLAQEVTMPAVTFAAQSLHVAGITIRDARDPLTVTLPFKMKAYPLELFDSVTLTIPRYGWSAKEFMVIGRQWTLDGLIQLTLKETAAAIFTMDASFSAQGYAANTNLPTPWSISPPANVVVASGSANIEVQADGSITTRVKVSWDAIADSSILNSGAVEVQYRLTSETDWHSVTVPGTATFVYLIGANPGDVGFVQVRTRNRVAVSDWSTIVSHTVTGKSAGPGAITGFTVTPIKGGFALAGTLPADLDIIDVELWISSTSSFGAAVLQTHGLANSFNLMGFTSADGPRWFWARCINRSLIQGPFTSPAVSTTALDLDGRRTATLTLYQWAASAPVTFPVGTSTYTWATGAFTDPGTLNGWTQTPGTGSTGQSLYACKQVYSDTVATATSTVTWSASTSIVAGSAGTTGATGSTGSTGATGPRGSLKGYGAQYGISSTSWSDAKANRVISNMLTGAVLTTDLATTGHLVLGDTVTLTNGTSFVGTKFWSGASWIAASTVIEGNVLVNGTGVFTGDLAVTGSAVINGTSLGNSSEQVALAVNTGLNRAGGIISYAGSSAGTAGLWGVSNGTGTEGVLGTTTTAGAVAVLGLATGAGTGVQATGLGGATALAVTGPMTINNSTLVTNLNADKLDGNDSSAFLAAGGTATNSSALGGVAAAGYTHIVVGDTGTATASGSGLNMVMGTGLSATYQVACASNNIVLQSISDETLKQDIAPETLGLDFAVALGDLAKVFRMISGPEYLQHGFTAQSIAALLTQHGFTGKDSLAFTNPNGKMGVNYQAFCGIFALAIKQLEARVRALGG